MKPSPTIAAACRCWRRCRKSPVACRSRLAPALQKANGGRGILLGGVPGVLPAKVASSAAASSACMPPAWPSALAPMSASSTSLPRLRQLDDIFAGRIHTRFSSIEALEDEVFSADLVIGAVLIPGAAAPKLVTREMLSGMKKGAVIVDVAIDQGGCFETSHATTHSDPTYEVDGVVHYCVANMPGAVPVTSAHALNNATLVYGLRLPIAACARSPRTSICAMASTSTRAASPTRRSPRRLAMRPTPRKAC
jgi:alanine dehydrogenase